MNLILNISRLIVVTSDATARGRMACFASIGDARALG
jgi:hypothetical protein